MLIAPVINYLIISDGWLLYKEINHVLLKQQLR